MHHEDRKIALQNLRNTLKALERLADRLRDLRDRLDLERHVDDLRRIVVPLGTLDRYVGELEAERAEFVAKLEAVQAAAFEQIRELSSENARLRLTSSRPVPSSAVLRIPPEPRKHSDRCGYPRNSCSCGAR